MKKSLAVVLIFMVLVPLFASQELYTANSYEVQTFKSLKRISGDNVVEPTYPISGTQLLQLLENLDTSSMNSKALSVFNNLVYGLEHSNDRFYEYEAGASASLHGRTSDVDISYDSLFFKPWERLPGLFLNGKVWWKDYANIKANIIAYDVWESLNVSKKLYLAHPFDAVPSRGPFEIDLSLGYDKLNFEIGRDRLSSGNGHYNLFMADNFPYIDNAKLSLIDTRYAYDFTFMNFEVEDAPGHSLYADFNGKSITVANHRFSMPLFNFLTLSVYESMLEYSDNPFDIRYLNPVMIMHNVESFGGGNNNNAFGVELSANLGKGFEFNAQVFVDQVQGKDEIEDNRDKDLPPSSFALLVNMTHSSAVANGVLDVWTEAVLSSPVCYLKETYPRFNEKYRWYQTDWLLAVRGPDICFEYLGYKYGPNTLGFALGADFRNRDLSVSAIVDYHLSGTYQKGDVMVFSWDTFYNYFPYTQEGEVFEHDFRIGASAKYNVIPGVTVQGSLGWVGSFNHNYISGNVFSDVQASLGVKLDAGAILDHYVGWRLK